MDDLVAPVAVEIVGDREAVHRPKLRGALAFGVGQSVIPGLADAGLGDEIAVEFAEAGRVLHDQLAFRRREIASDVRMDVIGDARAAARAERDVGGPVADHLRNLPAIGECAHRR
jgi:hypothetical protein